VKECLLLCDLWDRAVFDVVSMSMLNHTTFVLDLGALKTVKLNP
jgi:hypothetical protein